MKDSSMTIQGILLVFIHSEDNPRMGGLDNSSLFCLQIFSEIFVGKEMAFPSKETKNFVGFALGKC